MSNPVPADGQPIPGGVIAAVDETVIEQQGGVTYCLVAAIITKSHAARRDMQAVTVDRIRPFHWRREGPKNREAAIEHSEMHVTKAVVLAQRVGRQAQIKARGVLLPELVAVLADEGVVHVIIESQCQRDDGRDRSKILDYLSAQPEPDSVFTYDWRTKAEPLLWYPDTLAGVVREYLIKGTSAHYDRLQKAGIITDDIRYVR